MLILVVVIAILATNLLMGFFVAHYLGYGPRNFEELWTGVYLKPSGTNVSGLAEPLDRNSVDQLIRAAAVGIGKPPQLVDSNTASASSSVISPTEKAGAGSLAKSGPGHVHAVSDFELVTAIWRSVQVQRTIGLVFDRQRLLQLEHVLTGLELDLSAFAAEDPIAGPSVATKPGRIRSVPMDTGEMFGPEPPPSSSGDGLEEEDVPEIEESVSSQRVIPIMDPNGRFHWGPNRLATAMEQWSQYLQSIAPEEPLAWWPQFFKRWTHTQSLWNEYRKTLDALWRIQQAELTYQKGLEQVVCEDGTCRRVAPKRTEGRWWQRSSAELRVLAWSEGQRQRLFQDAFDQFMMARQAERRLLRQTHQWLNDTYKPKVLREVADKIELTANDVLWPGRPVTEGEHEYGYLLLVRRRDDWVREFCQGGVVRAALDAHRESCRARWFAGLPADTPESPGARPEFVDERTWVVWLPTETQEPAESMAWTLADTLESPTRKVNSTTIQPIHRYVLIPLGAASQPAAVVAKWNTHLEDAELPLWRSGHQWVWLVDGKNLRPVERPDSLPRVQKTVDLVAWYREHQVGEAGAWYSGYEPSAESDVDAKSEVANAEGRGDNGGSATSGDATPEDDVDW